MDIISSARLLYENHTLCCMIFIHYLVLSPQFIYSIQKTSYRHHASPLPCSASPTLFVSRFPRGCGQAPEGLWAGPIGVLGLLGRMIGLDTLSSLPTLLALSGKQEDTRAIIADSTSVSLSGAHNGGHDANAGLNHFTTTR